MTLRIVGIALLMAACGGSVSGKRDDPPDIAIDAPDEASVPDDDADEPPAPEPSAIEDDDDPRIVTLADMTLFTPSPLAAGRTLLFADNFRTLDIRPEGASSAVAYKWSAGAWYENPSGWASTNRIVGNGTTVTLNVQVGDSDGGINLVTDIRDPWNDPTRLRGTLFNKGYFEARMRWRVDVGAWPAFWLFSGERARSSASSPVTHWCEIDIFEGQGNWPATFTGTYHDWVDNGGTVSGTTNGNHVQALDPANDFSAWHTYGLLWETDTLSWYYDGVKTHDTPTPAICNQQHLYVDLGLGYGNDWQPRNTAGTTVDDWTNEVDWVRVYSP